MERKYAFFQHRDCEFFPCHEGAGENFNCLFCYCPLYFAEGDCGGSWTLTLQGVKDCSNCLFPHKKENYDAMIQKLAIAANNKK
mgnify:CR=1 FL=1